MPAPWEKYATDEGAFQSWYQDQARKLNLDPNPDAPEHFYDYRGAFKAGAQPDAEGHWPSQFKREGHPRMVIDGINTKTGQPAEGPWAKYGTPAQAAPDMSFGEQAADVAKSGGIGLVRGGIGLAGLPGDLQRGARAAASWIDPQGKFFTKESDPAQYAPSSGDIQRGIEGVTGEFYQPKSTAGKYAQTVGEFAPAALGGGGGALARGARVVVPGLASEAAGQATEGTAIEPYARIGAALLGGVGASRIGRPKQSPAPSIEKLGAQKSAAYKEAEAANVVLTPYKSDLIAKDVYGTLAKKGFEPDLHRDVAAAFKSLDQISGQPVTLQTLDLKRQILSDAATTKAQGRLVRKAIDRIDDHISDLRQTDVLTGNPQQAASAYQRARRTAHLEFKAEAVANALKKAERRTSRTGSGGNIDNAIRQEIGKILDNPKKLRGFTPDEIAMMEKINKGGKVQNFLRLAGKLSPVGSGLMAALGIGGTAAFPPLAAVPAGGMVAKAIADQTTRGRVGGLSELIRSGGRAVPRSGPSKSQTALINAILSSPELRRQLLPSEPIPVPGQ